MDTTFKVNIWQQFGAAIDMLDNALSACPDHLWHSGLWDTGAYRPEWAQFWYVGSHTLFWLDYYLSGSDPDFAPPAPFDLVELDPAGLLPERPYSREELQAYLQYGRRKCQATIEGLTDEKASQPCKLGSGEIAFVGLLLYNMRHVQEHAAQLSMFLGQKVGSAPRWVGKARNSSGV